jgi:hypothetical protein
MPFVKTVKSIHFSLFYAFSLFHSWCQFPALCLQHIHSEYFSWENKTPSLHMAPLGNAWDYSHGRTNNQRGRLVNTRIMTYGPLQSLHSGTFSQVW